METFLLLAKQNFFFSISSTVTLLYQVMGNFPSESRFREGLEVLERE